MWYYYFLISIFSIFACYKRGHWKQWDKYYSTILFFITGDTIYNILFQNNLLWRYVSPVLNHTIINMIIAFTVYPSTVLFFLPNHPKGILRQLIHFFLWISLYISVEYISFCLGYFKYDNGWNTLCSVIFNIGLFPLLYLHYKKPLLAWLVAGIELILVIILFKIDVLSLA
jgi:hypothetical protein